jgi:hypothetical protein
MVNKPANKVFNFSAFRVAFVDGITFAHSAVMRLKIVILFALAVGELYSLSIECIASYVFSQILRINSDYSSKQPSDIHFYNWYVLGFLWSSFIHSFIHPSSALQPFVGPWPLPQFRNLFYTDGRTHWASDQPVARPLPTHRTTQTQNKHTIQTSMPQVGFEPTIPAFERAKTVHALHHASTAIGFLWSRDSIFKWS